MSGNNILDKAIDNAQGVALEIYKDTIQPSAQSVGTVLSYIPRTIRLAFSKWEKWILDGEESIRITAEMLKDKIAQIPEDKLVEPEAFVAVPAIQQIAYCQNNNILRELYANLLASSMNSDKKWLVHPSFVDIIKQITPDEAKIINSISPFKNNFIPLIDVQLFDKNSNNKSGHQLFVTNFTTLGLDIIENPQNICGYIDNLIRLNILEIPATYHLTDPNRYTPLESHPLLASMIPMVYHTIYEIKYRHKVLQITNLGLMFKEVCCKTGEVM